MELAVCLKAAACNVKRMVRFLGEKLRATSAPGPTEALEPA